MQQEVKLQLAEAYRRYLFTIMTEDFTNMKQQMKQMEQQIEEQQKQRMGSKMLHFFVDSGAGAAAAAAGG